MPKFNRFFIYLLIFIGLNARTADEVDNEKPAEVIILVGPAKSGKRSFINSLGGFHGQLRAERNPRKARMFRILNGDEEPFWVIQTPDITKMDVLAWAQITKDHVNIFCRENYRIRAIILFESLNSEATVFPEYFEKLQAIFGENFREISLILFTGNQNKYILGRARETAKIYDFAHLMSWENRKPKKKGKTRKLLRHELEAQKDLFYQLLGKLEHQDDAGHPRCTLKIPTRLRTKSL
jgi:hypothetical protein